MLDVMFYEAFQEEEQALKKCLPTDIKAGFTPDTIQAVGEDGPPAAVISIRTQSTIPPGWSDNLNGILTRSAGYDHILKFRRETNKDLSCGHLVDYCSRAVAEHVVLTMLILLKKTKKQIQQFQTFNRDGLTGTNCQGRKMLVVGVGSIGGEVIRLAKGMGLDAKGVDIEEKHSNVEYCSLEDGVAWADIVVSAVPLTDETNGLLNYSLLKKSTPGLFLINISRAEISPFRILKNY